MKRLLLAALATCTLAAPAMAQYYGYPPPPPPSYGYGYGYQSPPPPPGYGYGYGYRPQPYRRVVRRVTASNLCVTARGSCEYSQYFRINTPCSCDIPGFGPKRGAFTR